MSFLQFFLSIVATVMSIRSSLKLRRHFISVQTSFLSTFHSNRLSLNDRYVEADDAMMDKFFNDSKISRFLINQLKRIDPSPAIDKAIYYSLYKDSPLGYNTGSGKKTMVKEIEEYKCNDIYADKIILYRVGSFYEAYGIDAIFLVAWCKLNFMSKKDGSLQAGFPWKSVQESLDKLTEQGLSVAIFEQVYDVFIRLTANFIKRVF